MSYLATYVVVLFTIQLVMVITGAPLTWGLFLLWLMLLIMLILFRRHLSYPQDHPHVHVRRQMLIISAMSLLFLMFSHVYLHWTVQQHHYSELLTITEAGNEDEMAVSGRISSMVQIDGNRVQFTLEVEDIRHEDMHYQLRQPEAVIVTHYVHEEEELNPYQTLSRGDQWIGWVQFREPQSARNPGAFDYAQYLLQEGIHLQAQVTNDEWISAANKHGWDRLLGLLEEQRERWMEQVDVIFEPEAASLIQAMTVGERAALDEQVETMYQELGIVHLLAISGLHVGVVLWFGHFLLRKLPITRETMYWILIGFIPVYMYLSGAQISVVRSGLMAMIVLLALRFGLWKHSLLGLYIVYVLLLLYDPYQIHHVGFQLSFSITFALLTMLPSVRSFLHWMPDRLRNVVAVALLAQVISLPFILYHFYQFSPLSFVLNLFIVPVFSLFLIPAGFGLTLLSFLSEEIIRLGGWMYEQTVALIHAGLNWVYSVPWSTLHMGAVDGWWILLYAIVLLVWIYFSEGKRLLLAWVSLTLLVVVVFVQWFLPYLDHRAYVTMLDVGQAEAIVVELPYREEVVLFDVGNEVSFTGPSWQASQSTFTAGENVVLPYLVYRGIDHVDKVVFSHGHYDHVAGLEDLLGRVTIDEVLKGPVLPQTEAKAHLLRQIEEHGIPITVVGAGDRWQTDHAYFQVLYPEHQPALVEQVQNVHDYNVVVWNDIYGTSFLWSGDVEEQGEMDILRRYPQLDVDVLKVGHHGSLTSTHQSWVDQLQPQVSLISAGRNNMYGHPHPEVIERLEEEQVLIFRTDQHGGVKMIIDQQGWEIEPSFTSPQ